MIIGVPKEIKANENRVALVPGGAEALVNAGHAVLIEDEAGVGSGFDNAAYEAAGVRIMPDAASVWREAEMIMKVKEPIASEWPHMRRDQVVFTYFHFAAAEPLTRAVMDSGCIRCTAGSPDLPSGVDRHRASTRARSLSSSPRRNRHRLRRACAT
jgi:alanine dehydrogenase